MNIAANSITDKFSTHLKKSLEKAYHIALTNKHKHINSEHLIYALIQQKGSIAAEILIKSGVSLLFAEKSVIFNNPKQTSTKTNSTFIPTPSSETKKILKQTVMIAQNSKHKYIGTEHLLSAIIQEQKNPSNKKVFPTSKIIKDISIQISTILKSTSKFPDITNTFNQLENTFNGEDEFEMEAENGLETFGRELTDPFIQTKIDPVIARDKEIQRVTEIILRRTKNNPLLIGQPGVGKTAIIEGLAKNITQGKVPPVLENKRIISLDLGSLISGTIYRGEFESRLKQIIAETSKDDDIILFIDEIHLLVGTGSNSGSMDAANILKPALARGDIRCIGATTFTEYRKYIENDSALERRFQTIRIEEPNEKNVLQILQGIKSNYEIFHQVNITNEAISAAVTYSKRYLPKRYFPDKAIDLLDEASAKKQITRKINKQQQQLKNLKKELEDIKINKTEAAQTGDYKKALMLREKQAAVQEQIQKTHIQTQNRPKKYKDQITATEIAQVVSSLLDIPTERILEQENKKILSLESTLKTQIIGQNKALAAIAKVIKRNAAGLANTSKPMGSFLFAGPSGVGKTYSAKILAQTVFGSSKALIKLDMSEYSEKFNLSKLLGAPAGYVGYEQSGILSNRILEHPYSVILFDEIEKAHPEVFNILLQILDEGKLTDAQGKTVNFTNNIIILTSNQGNTALTREDIGFGHPLSNRENIKNMSKSVENSLKDYFLPELLNRLEQKIIFSPLSQSSLEKIAKIKLDQINQNLATKGIFISPTPSAIRYLVTNSQTPQEGARKIDLNIQHYITDKLADLILEQKIKKNATIKIGIKDKNIVFSS